MSEVRDAYSKLFIDFDRDSFFKKGIDDIIFIESEDINKEWHKLKKSLFENKEVFIRGYGRDARKTNMYLKLYETIFGNNKIKKDPSNNSEPTKILQMLTNYSKIKTSNKTQIINYQVSHLFGKTKNPLLFTSPWNIAYIPKYLDPFTGHETKGKHSSDFKIMMNEIIQLRFKEFIRDYNFEIKKRISRELISIGIEKVIKEFNLKKNEIERFENDVKAELCEI